MNVSRSLRSLKGKKGLVVGVSSRDSIAWGCADAFRAEGAELAITWHDDETRPHVEALADELQASIRLPLDVTQPGALEAVFETIQRQWGRLDFVLHAIANEPQADLHGRVSDSSPDGLAQAMDVSCHSFVRMAHLAEPLMRKGGSLMTMSFPGADKGVPHHGVPGPVQAALESSVRYLATELGPKGIRVSAVSPGHMHTRAASGIADFDALLADAQARSPMRRLANNRDVGALCAFLASDAARAMTGDTLYVDSGFHILN